MWLFCGSSVECVAWLALMATEKNGILSKGFMHIISATTRHGRDHVYILIVCLPRFQATRSSRRVQLSLLQAQAQRKCLPQREGSNASEGRSSQV